MQNTVPTHNDFAELLGIRTNHTKTETWVQSRLVSLELGKTCERCGGSGNYSYCQMYGTRCFGCGGSGSVPQKLSAALFEQAKAKVEDGSNAKIQERNRLATQAKKVLQSVMDAWKAASELNPYYWMKACSGRNFCPLHAKASEFNKRMCDAYEKVSMAEQHLHSTQFKLRKDKITKEEAEVVRSEIRAETAEYVKLGEWAIGEVNAASADVAQWRATLTEAELAGLTKTAKLI